MSNTFNLSIQNENGETLTNANEKGNCVSGTFLPRQGEEIIIDDNSYIVVKTTHEFHTDFPSGLYKVTVKDA